MLAELSEEAIYNASWIISMHRVPVVDPDGKPLMPTLPSRARRWLKAGKAVKRWSDLGVFYVQLTEPPSNAKTQPIVVGIDPGKLFSGIAAQSAQATLLMAHLILPFETVKKRMEQRRVLRRTRRARRINRDGLFKQRNHRQKRFANRIRGKLPLSIRANRQLEIRVVQELATIFPVTKIVWEYLRADVDLTSGRKGARSGRGFSPVMVGQKWAIEQRKDKAQHAPQSHAVDGVALAASEFVAYRAFRTGSAHGHDWQGNVSLTACPFRIIRRPPICRRQLHRLQPAKGGRRRAYGGTTTRHGLRKGDLVGAEMAGRVYIGWVSGDTARQVSVSDIDWKRLGQFTASKVELLKRNTNLLASGALNPIQPALVSSTAQV